jgi:AraC-like DNA-binding protein
VAHAHAGGLTALGLLVRPGAAACLLGASSGAVVDQVLPWSEVAGASEAERLEHEVQSPIDDLARVRALMDSLARTMAALARGRDQAYTRLCTAVGLQGAQAGAALGLGRRQLERQCQAILGLSPKRFQRIVRFHRALSLAVTDKPPVLTGVALDAGFYDQSHWARDARQLAGAPIGHLMAQARPDSAWWPLATRRGPAQGRLASQWLPG